MRFLEFCEACENGEHRKCVDAEWQLGSSSLRQCSCRGRCLATIELGRRGEREQFIESSYNPMTTMTQMLRQRVFSKREDVRKQKLRDEYVPRLEIKRAGPNPHAWPCDDPLCTRCDEAEKRLLRDCGVLPGGRKKIGRTGKVESDLWNEPTLVPTRYRRDESNR